MALDLDELTAELREFVRQRDWEQFHNPKNLAMALAGEAGELLAELQWIDGDESERSQLDDSVIVAIEDEIADVLFYLLLLSERLGVDLSAATRRKLSENTNRYTIDSVQGSALKAQ